MKESIEENKVLLKKKFPDDVTTTGNPDLGKGKYICPVFRRDRPRFMRER